LEEIQHVEDLQLLSGHIYMILGNLEKAQVRRNISFKFFDLLLMKLLFWFVKRIVI
jgi:hypothetical protein